MKATAESIETEYFTNPDGEAYENAHVTVFNLKISELYKGEMGARNLSVENV